jgi:predicted acyltransferase
MKQEKENRIPSWYLSITFLCWEKESHAMNTLAPSKRLLSLDAFRGATIVAMILVNNPGSWAYIYPQLRHAEWNGWTMTDWIFPFFLFTVGITMTLSFARRIESGAPVRQLYTHILIRTIIIFALGLFLNGFPYFHFSEIRIPGVLQRIAICYGIASIIFFHSTRRGQLYWTAGLLAVYWLIMQCVPVPGIGPGIYEPGKNFSNYIDSIALAGHMWNQTVTWDPEGIVSTLPSIATVLFGVLTGHLIRSEKTQQEKIIQMYAAGTCLIILGIILDMWIPINKKLWTSSFSVFTAGWANVCLATCIWLFDIKGYSRYAKPLIIFGLNAIAVYCISELVAITLGSITVTDGGGIAMSVQEYLYTTIFLPITNPVNASLLFAISFILIMYVFVWVLWKKNWFLKV